jgi:predicted nuclease with TOPRIM domain
MAIQQVDTKTEEITAQLQNLSEGFARLSAQTLSDETRFKLIEQTTGRHDEEIRRLKDSTRMMQLQFDQVMTKIDTLEMKLFSWLQQTQQDSVKERAANNKQWFQFLTFVLGGTIIAIVTAVFVKGGL